MPGSRFRILVLFPTFHPFHDQNNLGVQKLASVNSSQNTLTYRLSTILIDIVTVLYARWRFLYFTKIRILLAQKKSLKIVKLCLQLSYNVQNSVQFDDIFSWKISKLQKSNYFDTKYPIYR